MKNKRILLLEELLLALDRADDPVTGMSWKADEEVRKIRKALKETSE